MIEDPLSAEQVGRRARRQGRRIGCAVVLAVLGFWILTGVGGFVALVLIWDGGSTPTTTTTTTAVTATP